MEAEGFSSDYSPSASVQLHSAEPGADPRKTMGFENRDSSSPENRSMPPKKPEVVAAAEEVASCLLPNCDGWCCNCTPSARWTGGLTL